MTGRQSLRSRGRDGWIPLLFIAFFLVVFGVNGVLVWVAVSTYNGLAVASPYERGIAYNEAIEQQHRQEALGWKAELAFRGTGAREGTVELHLVDAAGQPVAGADASLEFYRPVHQGTDFRVGLREHGPGLYGAAVQLPLSGLWEVRILAERRADRLAVARRIVVE
jgi:nitrogen fixation protein FixH